MSITVLTGSHVLPRATPETRLLVSVVDSSPNSPRLLLALQSTYGLTAREARVAALLATGTGRHDVGRLLAVSPEAIKKHTSAIFRKTGTQSQAGLATVVADARYS